MIKRKRERVKIIKISILLTIILALGFFVVNETAEKPPLTLLKQCRETILLSKRAGADIYQSKSFNSAENYYNLAQQEWSMQDKKIKAARNYDSLKILINLSLKSSQSALSKTEEIKDSLKHTITKELKALEKTLDGFKEKHLKIPLKKETISKLTKCRVMAHECSSLLERGDYIQAEKLLTKTKRISAELVNNTGKALEDYLNNTNLWQKWIKETIEWSIINRSHAIIIDKIAHKCYVYKSGKRILEYNVELGTNWIGDKAMKGDRTTPEGKYKIVKKLGRGQSKYYKALLINYPNEEDQERFAEAKKKGRIPANAKIGGLIELHGHGGKGFDWTEGCVALTDKEMDKIFDLTAIGTPVTIVGTVDDLNTQNL